MMTSARYTRTHVLHVLAVLAIAIGPCMQPFSFAQVLYNPNELELTPSGAAAEDVNSKDADTSTRMVTAGSKLLQESQVITEASALANIPTPDESKTTYQLAITAPRSSRYTADGSLVAQGIPRGSSISRSIAVNSLSDSCLTVRTGWACLRSTNSRFRACLSASDEQLALFDGDRAYWATTRTSAVANASKAPFLCSQNDGNLVTYARNWRAVWASNSNFDYPAPITTVIQDDGNLVMYDGSCNRIWSSMSVQDDTAEPHSCVPSVDIQAQQTITWRADMLSRVNALRRKAGVPALVLNAALNKAAQKHSRDMDVRNYFSHTTPDGISFAVRFQRDAARHANCAAGENIAMGQGSVEVVVTSWFNSPGHKANMLNPSYRAIGAGRAPGNIWTQLFSSCTV